MHFPFKKIKESTFYGFKQELNIQNCLWSFVIHFSFIFLLFCFFMVTFFSTKAAFPFNFHLKLKLKLKGVTFSFWSTIKGSDCQEWLEEGTGKLKYDRAVGTLVQERVAWHVVIIYPCFLLFQKTDYFHLWFLYKSVLRIFCFINNGVFNRIKPFLSQHSLPHYWSD